MILYRRFLPFLVPILVGWAFLFQSTHASLYPWIALLPVLVVLGASCLIAWGHVAWRDVLEKMSPLWLFLACVGFAQLLLESSFAQIAVAIVAAIATLIGLELLFLLAFDPIAYPINGLAYLNIALVPAIAYFAFSTAWGVWVFVHTPIVWNILLGAFLGLILFRTTGHPGATREQNNRWMIVGLLAGAEIGWLITLMPVSMPVEGTLAAIGISGILRMRRYLYEPQPPRTLARIELIGVFTCLLLICMTAKWI